ncbi:MAG: hypothetical protein ABI562_00985 [Chloroflexota bacterium]
MHRVRRHAAHSVATHERARALAATRVDWPLDADDTRWLDEHLSTCLSCRSVAAEYETDRQALRTLRDRQPEPPRDLWARTSAALERESASRGGRSRRAAGSGRGATPALGMLSGVAGIAVLVVVIGASLLSGGFLTGPGAVPGASAPAIAAGLSSGLPGATPIAVGAGSVEWVGTSPGGKLAYNVTKIDAVCPADRQPDCAPIADRDAKPVELTIRPRSISQSPVKNQAVVVGTDAGGGDSVVVIALPTTEPSPTASPRGTPIPPPTSPTVSPTATATASETPASSSEPPASVEPTPSIASSASPTESATPVVSATPEVTPESTPTVTPEPTVAASLAIATGVKVVGQSAAYSPDGSWFAFTARPSDGTSGPDIYIWRVGDQQARPLTNDHVSVFASWAGRRLLGSRVATDAAAGEINPKSFFVDPASGEQTLIAGTAWRPTVDPTDHWAVAWNGTVKVAPDGRTQVPATGSLVLRRFGNGAGFETDPPVATVADGPFSEFDVRWDETGTWLAVWLADASDPSVGRLSLLQLDPVTGELDRPHGAPHDVTALPGLSIANGRLAWATPPGQGGEGSRVQIVAWTDKAVGAVESGPVEDVVVIH